MNDAELEALLDDIESDRAERKETASDGDKLRQIICAFENDYRNPNLAAVMKEMGYVQRFGFGIPLARSEMEKNGNPPPEFQVEDAHIAVTLRRR